MPHSEKEPELKEQFVEQVLNPAVKIATRTYRSVFLMFAAAAVILFGVWDGLITIVAFLAYRCQWQSITHGGTTNWVSWGLWLGLSAFMAFSSITETGKFPILPLVYGAGNAVMLILSLRRKPSWGYSETVALMCLIALGIVAVQLPAYAPHAVLIAFIIAAIPLTVVMWEWPERVHLGTWTYQCIGGLITWLTCPIIGPKGTWIGIEVFFFNLLIIFMVRIRQAQLGISPHDRKVKPEIA